MKSIVIKGAWNVKMNGMEKGRMKPDAVIVLSAPLVSVNMSGKDPLVGIEVERTVERFVSLEIVPEVIEELGPEGAAKMWDDLVSQLEELSSVDKGTFVGGATLFGTAPKAPEAVAEQPAASSTGTEGTETGASASEESEAAEGAPEGEEAEEPEAAAEQPATASRTDDAEVIVPVDADALNAAG